MSEEIHASGREQGSRVRIPVPSGEVTAFCRRHHIRRLALFGSVIRPDFRPESDVDVLVEFAPGHVPGFIRLGAMARELSTILGGREVDLVTPRSLHPTIRKRILAASLLLHDAA